MHEFYFFSLSSPCFVYIFRQDRHMLFYFRREVGEQRDARIGCEIRLALLGRGKGY